MTGKIVCAFLANLATCGYHATFKSWIFGANIPGKANTVMFYMAGLGACRQVPGEVVEKDYRGFVLHSPPIADVRVRAAVG